MKHLEPQDESHCVMTDTEQFEAMDSIAEWAVERAAKLVELDRMAAGILMGRGHDLGAPPKGLGRVAYCLSAGINHENPTVASTSLQSICIL